MEQALDPRTRLILFKMLSHGVFKQIYGCISTGKEANVYHAVKEDGTDLAVKVYKTSILVFKDRDRYVSGDWRWRNGYSKKNPRKMVQTWAEKEMRNLIRLREARLRVPEVVQLRSDELEGAAKARAELVSTFLERTQTQLTYAGLAEIHSTLRENEVGVLYRNLHFATVFKRDGVLYALVTDIGCRRPASFFTPRASRRWRALTRPPAQTASRRTSSGSASTTSAATRTSATRRSNPRRRRRARTPTIC